MDFCTYFNAPFNCRLHGMSLLPLKRRIWLTAAQLWAITIQSQRFPMIHNLYSSVGLTSRFIVPSSLISMTQTNLKEAHSSLDEASFVTKERITDENCHGASTKNLNSKRTHARTKLRGTGEQNVFN